jgi:hypothetical protein
MKYIASVSFLDIEALRIPKTFPGRGRNGQPQPRAAHISMGLFSLPLSMKGASIQQQMNQPCGNLRMGRKRKYQITKA